MFLPASIEPLHSQIHELGIFGEIPVGIFNRHMTEVGREYGEKSLNILACAIPINQRANCESVPKIMQTRAGPGYCLSNSSHDGQRFEHLIYAPMIKACSVRGCEEMS